MMVNSKFIYNTKDLNKLILSSGTSYKSSSLYNKIDEMENNGKITRVGRNQYIFGDRKVFNYELNSNTAKRVNKLIKNRYSSDFEYVIYETVSTLNQFLNHLINRNVIILETNKFFLEHVFNTLKEAGFRNILFNPDKEDVFRYVEDDSIILMPLVSKAPIDRKNKKTTIEKITVDMICSTVLNCFYEGAELHNIVEDVLSNYKVRYDTLNNYAKRRHASERLKELAPKSMKDIFND
ncbi:MAG: hypothetical protein IJ247_06215 [Bacilli bacterium]|nr:hypothetical protein [Bacilli bacterium]